MNKMEVIWLSPFVGAFAGCVSSVLVLMFFWFWRLLSEQSSRQAMTGAAAAGAVSGLMAAVVEALMHGEGPPITLWRNTFGEWISLSGNTELLGAAFSSAWLLGGLVAAVVAFLKQQRHGPRRDT